MPVGRMRSEREKEGWRGEGGGRRKEREGKGQERYGRREGVE